MEDCARTAGGSGGLQGLVSEFAQRVVAALEQLAGDGQAGAVAAQARGGLEVVVVIGSVQAGGRTWAASKSAQRNAEGPWRDRRPGARRASD
jgi:hypothetical protein